MHVAFDGVFGFARGRHDDPGVGYSTENVFVAGVKAIANIIRAPVVLMVETDEIVAVSGKDVKRELAGCSATAGYEALDFAKVTTNDEGNALFVREECIDGGFSLPYMVRELQFL